MNAYAMMDDTYPPFTIATILMQQSASSPVHKNRPTTDDPSVSEKDLSLPARSGRTDVYHATKGLSPAEQGTSRSHTPEAVQGMPLVVTSTGAELLIVGSDVDHIQGNVLGGEHRIIREPERLRTPLVLGSGRGQEDTGNGCGKSGEVHRLLAFEELSVSLADVFKAEYPSNSAKNHVLQFAAVEVTGERSDLNEITPPANAVDMHVKAPTPTIAHPDSSGASVASISAQCSADTAVPLSPTTSSPLATSRTSSKKMDSNTRTSPAQG